MFIGRQTELKYLNDYYNSGKAEFVILYGRRRIGKTETLKEFCKGKTHILYSCSQCLDSNQFDKFTEALSEFNPEYRSKIKRFIDWEDAFSSLAEIGGKERLVIVIDEFPYMAKANKSIQSILQNLWDNKLKDSNIMLILSGSLISFIEDKVLASKNPLYGRATGVYKMEPLPFHDAIKFFPNYSDKDKFLAYALLGGIPHYLRQFDSNLTLEENIKRKILTKGTVLYGEVEYLLNQELREPTVYNTILEAIAFGSSHYNEISEKTLVNSNNISIYLKSLIDLGLLQREFPITETQKKKSNKNLGEYKILDNFFRFWYAYAFPYKSLLEDGQADKLFDNVIAKNLNSFASKAFENISIYYLKRLNAEDKTPFWFTDIGRWWGKVTKKDENDIPVTISEEIDILAYGLNKNEYIVGECKLTNELFDMHELRKLYDKVMRKGNIYYYLFSLNGFTEAVLNEAAINTNVKLVTLHDIIALASKY